METRRGELLTIVGAALLFIGPMLNFLDVTGPGGSFSGSGYDLEEGSSYVLAGIVALVGLAMAWFMQGGGRKAGGVIVLIAGVFGAYAGFVDAFTDPDGIPAGVEVSHGIGTYVVTIAGLLVAAGGSLIMKSAAPVTTTTVAPPPSDPPAV